MDAYVAEIRKLENKFSGLEIHHVVRDNNVAADVLQNSALTERNFLPESSSMSFITPQSIFPPKWKSTRFPKKLVER